MVELNKQLVFYSDPIQTIFSYLHQKDVCKLMITYDDFSKENYNYFCNRAIEEINRRLKNLFGTIYDEFKQELEKNRAIISGSFILQCIMGEEWPDSDIDIYVPVKNIQLNQKFLRGTHTNLEKFLCDHLWDECVQWGESHQYINKTIIAVRDYIFLKEGIKPPGDRSQYDQTHIDKTKPKLQIIQMDVEANYQKLIEMLTVSFDFDILKNFYHIRNHVDQLPIYKICDILKRETPFGLGDRFHVCLQRMKKYEKRGFIFTGDKKEWFKMIMDAMKLMNHPIYKIFTIGKLSDDEIQKIRLLHELPHNEIPYRIIDDPMNFPRWGILIIFDNVICINEMHVEPCNDDCLIKLCSENKEHFHHKDIIHEWMFVINDQV